MKERERERKREPKPRAKKASTDADEGDFTRDDFMRDLDKATEKDKPGEK